MCLNEKKPIQVWNIHIYLHALKCVCVCVRQVQCVKMQMMCSVGGTWEMYIFFSSIYDVEDTAEKFDIGLVQRNEKM